jgi:hypothetical protein
MGLMAGLVLQAKSFNKERQQLLDRIMSKTYVEYKGYSDSPEENQLDTDDLNYIDIESAREAIISEKE